MQWFQRLLLDLRSAGLSEEEYHSILPNLDGKNRRALQTSLPLGSVILFLLFLSSFVMQGLESNRVLYLFTFLALFLLSALSRTLLVCHPRWTLALFYVFLFVCYAFAIVVGTILQPDISATTFCVLLLGLPLLIADRPLRIDLFLTLVTVIFCIATIYCKEARLAQADIINVIVFHIIGLFTNYHVIQTKTHDALLRCYMEKDKDTDDLSKLLTKAAFQRELARYLEETPHPSTLLFLDIDDFKLANDTFGHAYGDTVLRISGECISTVFRQSDLLSRFGGDEFVLFLPGLAEETAVAERLERLTALLRERLSSPDSGSPITVSIGAAFFPQDALDAETLLTRADTALYAAKNGGKNRYRFYQSLTMQERV